MASYQQNRLWIFPFRPSAPWGVSESENTARSTLVKAGGGQPTGGGGECNGGGGPPAASGGPLAPADVPLAGSGGPLAPSGGPLAGSGGLLAPSGGPLAGSGGLLAPSGGPLAGSGGPFAASDGPLAPAGGPLAALGGTRTTSWRAWTLPRREKLQISTDGWNGYPGVAPPPTCSAPAADRQPLRGTTPTPPKDCRARRFLHPRAWRSLCKAAYPTHTTGHCRRESTRPPSSRTSRRRGHTPLPAASGGRLAASAGRNSPARAA